MGNEASVEDALTALEMWPIMNWAATQRYSNFNIFCNILNPGMGKFLKYQPVPSTPSPQRLRNCRSSPVPNYLLEKYPVQVPVTSPHSEIYMPRFLKKMGSLLVNAFRFKGKMADIYISHPDHMKFMKRDLSLNLFGGF